MNVKLNLILLCIVAVLGGWYLSQTDSTAGLEQLIKKEGEPEYRGNQLTTSVYDLSGKPQYFAQATEIKRYESTERTEFIKPLLNLFDQVTALKQWQLTADYAEITKEKMLYLKGNVVLESLEPAPRLQKIETDSLTVDLTTQDIQTESVVKTLGSGFTTTGTGLKGNLKQQIATLTSDVKTYLEPTIIKQAEPTPAQKN